MSSTAPHSFASFVPGFDFLEGLVKNAGAALPTIGQWVAPTLNPEELEKRIEELRTVQFWLEQNAKMLGATIQALEVQRMTLSTLKTMNVQMNDLRESLQIKTPAQAPAPPPPSAASKPGASAASAESSGAVDPMQWWGALTQQFTELAAAALRDGAAGATKAMAEAAGAMAQPSEPASAGSAAKPKRASAGTANKGTNRAAKTPTKQPTGARKRAAAPRP
ncbi:MAG TPA: PhaM family polyhydroxyalkanoate granule multifunctional regulatory protein [Burkholderiaceae bacterium]|nr:PhaM family polyhydroxyalkanoate granule multifunctional regulatory protein [Burkholderiaceae bacterium]